MPAVRKALPAPIPGHRCDELCEPILAQKAHGLTTRQIAATVGLTRQAVGTRIRHHRGRATTVIPYAEHVCDARCAQVLTLRASGLTYAQMSQRMGLTKQAIGQLVVGHTRAIRSAGGRSGVSACVTCHRQIGKTLPDTRLLPPDECCSWCARRWDGDVRNVTPVLLELARTIGTQDRRVAMQHLRAWPPRERRNAAETRERFSGPPNAADFEERDESDES